MLTLSQRRSWAKHGDREIQRTIDAAKAELRDDEQAEQAERRRRRQDAVRPVAFSVDELRAATHVRTDAGWHKVVRVNPKSVTVATGYSWTDQYAVSKILEVRCVAAAGEAWN